VVAFAEEAPLAPLSPNQLRFLALHTHHRPERWTWHFCETMLRAATDRGRTATIWRDDLADLMGRGLMEQGAGYADVRVTDAGRAACKVEKERV
jgi:hypothetical protein